MSKEHPAAPVLPWSDSFSTGIEVLDADHRALVQGINDICACWRAQRRSDALRALGALVALAREHFQREEAVLRSLASYDRLPEHASEHRARLKQLTDLVQRFHDSGDAGDATPLCTSLIDWFLRQSIGHDAAIKGYFDNGAARFAEPPRPAR